MRLDTDTQSECFVRWLLDLGHGSLGSRVGDRASIEIPKQMVCVEENDLIWAIYGSMSNDSMPPAPSFFHERVILAPSNKDVRKLNSRILALLPGEQRTYVSADSHSVEPGAEQYQKTIPVEFLHSLNASGLPLAHLQLKVGSPIIILRNLDPKRGLCNGTRATILRMSNRVLEVRLLGGGHDGEMALIPRISLSPSIQGANFSMKLTRRQFPVQLAFAMTINKAQGQSVSYVGLDLRTPVFAHGQLYVAFSRAKSPHRVKVLLHEPTVNCHVQNVVYPEILLD